LLIAIERWDSTAFCAASVPTGWENMKTIGWPTPTAIPGDGNTLAVTMLAGGAVVKVPEPFALNVAAVTAPVPPSVAGPAPVLSTV
jgi:hypothetical protein